ARGPDLMDVLLTMNQSGCSTSFRRWQEFVVTELAPAHHSRENSQRSFTTHRFTVILSALKSCLFIQRFCTSTHLSLIKTLNCRSELAVTPKHEPNIHNKYFMIIHACIKTVNYT
uniref:Uncharacterized protein n=1 Tax=Oryzias melastigma TaxID=30732 RepID=A0A3B3CEH0_ORYME